MAEVEARVHATMATLALDGFPREHVDAVVHQVMIPPHLFAAHPATGPEAKKLRAWPHCASPRANVAPRPRPDRTTIQCSIRPPHTSRHIARIAILTTVVVAVPSSLPPS